MNLTRLPGGLSGLLAAGAVAALVAVGLSGCTSTLGYAAVVNGVVITQSSINNELAGIAANKTYVGEINQGGAGPVVGTGTGSYNKRFVAELLDQQVRYEIIRQELVAKRALPTAALVATAKSEVSQAFPTGVFAAFPASYQALLSTQQAESDSFVSAATSDLSADAVNTYYQAHQSDYATEACVSHILLAQADSSGTINFGATLAQANMVKSLLDAGGDFGALAKQYSQDNQGTTGGSAAAGGALAGSAADGCLTTQDLQQLPAAFSQAVISLPVNTVSAPVKTQFGYHLIEVTKRVIQPLNSAVMTDIHQRVAGDRLSQLVTAAKVKVNPAFGSFNNKVDPSSGQIFGVLPPVVPNLVTTTTVAAPPASGG